MPSVNTLAGVQMPAASKVENIADIVREIYDKALYLRGRSGDIEHSLFGPRTEDPCESTPASCIEDVLRLVLNTLDETAMNLNRTYQRISG